MDRLDTMQTFVRVVESGSFSVAAREFGVGQPAVSKQMAALEAEIGAELIRRSSRTLSLAEVGRDFYESTVRLLDDCAIRGQVWPKRAADLRGLLRAVASRFETARDMPRQ